MKRRDQIGVAVILIWLVSGAYYVGAGNLDKGSSEQTQRDTIYGPTGDQWFIIMEDDEPAGYLKQTISVLDTTTLLERKSQFVLTHRKHSYPVRIYSKIQIRRDGRPTFIQTNLKVPSDEATFRLETDEGSPVFVTEQGGQTNRRQLDIDRLPPTPQTLLAEVVAGERSVNGDQRRLVNPLFPVPQTAVVTDDGERNIDFFEESYSTRHFYVRYRTQHYDYDFTKSGRFVYTEMPLSLLTVAAPEPLGRSQKASTRRKFNNYEPDPEARKLRSRQLARWLTGLNKPETD